LTTRAVPSVGKAALGPAAAIDAALHRAHVRDRGVERGDQWGHSTPLSNLHWG